MYIGRSIEQLRSLPFDQWTQEELAYHRDTMIGLQNYLTPEGLTLLQKVQQEIQSRGGLPHYGGDYEHASELRYD